MYNYQSLIDIAEIEYADIVDYVESVGRKLRINLKDETYIDIFYSVRSTEQRYGYHWERALKDGKVYRHDNIPDGMWANISTFPKHFHNGAEEQVEESYLSDVPEMAIREFLEFVRLKIREQSEANS